MKTKFKALLRALPVLLLATLAFTATVVPVSAAVAPGSGVVGSPITINQSSVASGATYSVMFAQAGVDKGTAGSVTASGTTISSSVAVPQLPAGTYNIWLRHATETDINTGDFTIIPSILVGATASVGSTVSITGLGFTASPIVTILIDGVAVTSNQTVSAANGTFTATFTVPAVSRGNHVITVRDQILNQATAFLGVTPGIFTVAPVTGKVGDTVTITGGGFTASGAVEIYIDNVAAESLLKTVTATSTGTLPSGTTIIIPNTTRGDHDLIVKDVTTSTSSIAPHKKITITPAITIVSPSGANPSGPVNSQIELKGSGFNANSTITFKFDGATLTTTTQTDDKGSFSNATITVPTNKTSGTYVITASDSTGAAPGVEFTVAASITLNPTSGTAGSPVYVQGNGFQTTGTVSITYDNAVMTTATLTDGTFTANFTIPGGVAGVHTVRATDGLGNTAVATFTSTLSATLSPITSTAAPGHVGQDLTLTGTGFLPTSAITASFGTTAIGSATSDATGAFTITFKAPAVAAGSHTVTVTDGTNSRTFTFVMEGNAPAAPELVTPDGVNKPKQPIIYEWSDVEDPSGVTYTLEVFTTPELNVLILKKEGLTTSSYTAAETEKLPSVSKDAPYYWRVTAIDGAGNVGTPAQAIAFTVGFSFSDLIPDNVPTWAWITIGVSVVLIAGGLIYYFWRRSYSY